MIQPHIKCDKGDVSDWVIIPGDPKRIDLIAKDWETKKEVMYNKYHEKGFDVIGVSLDTRAEDWKGAIATDGLAWNHISNLMRFQDPIAQLYNINAIPAAFLLDENGVIVAKDLRGPELEQKVAELLN